MIWVSREDRRMYSFRKSGLGRIEEVHGARGGKKECVLRWRVILRLGRFRLWGQCAEGC
jgi:hypothetical protein